MINLFLHRYFTNNTDNNIGYLRDGKDDTTNDSCLLPNFREEKYKRAAQSLFNKLKTSKGTKVTQQKVPKTMLKKT